MLRARFQRVALVFVVSLWVLTLLLVEKARSEARLIEGSHRSLSEEQKWPRLPWQQPHEWTPPCAPYINDLPGLIHCQRRPGIRWLTTFALTHLHEESHAGWLLINTLTSYLLVGGGESYIVMVPTEEALHGCVSLRLPCYNATGQVDSRYLNGYNLGTWGRTHMMRLVLRALPPDLNLHVSDHDVVYLKKIIPSIERFGAQFPEFDIMAQYENHPRRGINTGVVFARNTPRVHTMYDEWLAFVTSDDHEQNVFHLNMIGNRTIVLGADAESAAAGNASVARIVRYNSPFIDKYWCHWCHADDYQDCWYEDNPRHCELPYRWYIHTICVLDKVKYTQGLGLWFLDRNNPFATNYTAIASAGLPCAPPHDVGQLQVELQ